MMLERGGHMQALLALVIIWCLLIAAAFWVSARRRREFERALAAAGFVISSPVPPLPDPFRRPGAIVTRVATGMVRGVPTTFVFGFRPGVPPPLEGTFVNPSIPIAAALLEMPGTRAWLEAWTDHRADKLGWRPAYAADLTRDGRILLVWDDFAELATQFESCREALARSLGPKARGPEIRRHDAYPRPLPLAADPRQG
jgi:hypothetical protein